MQDLALWHEDDQEKGCGSAQTLWEEFINDLKAVGTTVPKKIIGIPCRNGLNLAHKKAHVQDPSQVCH